MSDRRRASWSVQSPLRSFAATNSQWRGYHGIDESRNSSIEEMDCDDNVSPSSISFTRHRTPIIAKPLERYSLGSPASYSRPVQHSTPTGPYSQQFGRKPSPSSLFSQLHLSEASSIIPALVTITSSTPSQSDGLRYPIFHRATTPMNTSRASPRCASVIEETPDNLSQNYESSIVKRGAGDDSAMEVSGGLATDDERNVIKDNFTADSSVCCGANKKTSVSRRQNNDLSKWSFSRRLSLCLLVTIAVIIVSFIVNDGRYISMTSPRRCGSTIDIDDLERSLVDRVYGQHLAVQIVYASFKKFLSSTTDHLLVLSFHGWTGIGKNHMSNVIADRFTPADVRRFIVPLHFPHSSVDDAANLREWILSNISSSACGLQLFVIDEVDKAGSELITSLHDVISTVAQTVKNASESTNELSLTKRIKKVIVLLLSNTGGGAINAYVMSALMAGHSRESISYTDVIEAMNRAQVGPWYENMTAEHLVQHLVPFLPLERSHVRQCVDAVFRSRGVEAITKQMIDAVLDQLQWFPQDTNLFSTAGCRKVPSQVDLLLG